LVTVAVAVTVTVTVTVTCVVDTTVSDPHVARLELTARKQEHCEHGKVLQAARSGRRHRRRT
jgi:hypothetical protein